MTQDMTAAVRTLVENTRREEKERRKGKGNAQEAPTWDYGRSP